MNEQVELLKRHIVELHEEFQNRRTAGYFAEAVEVSKLLRITFGCLRKSLIGFRDN